MSEIDKLTQDIDAELRRGLPPRAHDLAALDQRMMGLLKMLKDDQDLRKWAVEKAVAVCTSPGNQELDPVLLSDSIFKFVAEEKVKAVSVLGHKSVSAEGK